MSNYDKIVKLACKPKNAPPKDKYVDQLVSATYSDDGSLQDISRSLSLRLREPNAIVVFKALLTLHMMMRSGSTDSLLEHLSQSDVLRLRNVSGQNWEGYSPPSSMGYYAQYLDARIRAFRDLKHDLVRVQTESNRRSDGLGAASKARRLRHLPVEKGLLREVNAVQKILDALVQCKFYDDDLRDENTVLAFRMLVKDLLVLFQAGNEGVCNILEHYFEMSKYDATEALDIYKAFIKHTNKVVDYLGVARKLHNVVNIPVPNLKHAPTSLVKALEEYLNDPNFEQNRKEYKRSLGVVEGKVPSPGRTPSPAAAKPAENQSKPIQQNSSAPTSNAAPSSSSLPPAANQKIQDFLDSIQADHQPTMFGGPASNGFGQSPQVQMYPQMTGMGGMGMMQMGAGMPGQPQQQPFNPFRQSMMMPQQTGFPVGQGQMPFAGQQQPQPQATGGMEFLQPQMTGAMAFGNRTSMFQPTPQQHVNLQNNFMQQQPQQPQATGFLQPQNTGSNPFRQSMMLNTTTQAHNGAFSQPSSPLHSHPISFGSQIQRPGSVPAGAVSSNLPQQQQQQQQPKSLVAQPTGSKNPFAPAGGVPPPKPQEGVKAPTMAELSMQRLMAQSTGFPGGFQPQSSFGNQQIQQPQQQQTQQQQQQTSSPWSSVNGKASSPGAGTGISDIASAFALDGSSSKGTDSNTDFLSQFGSLSMGSTGATTTSQQSFGSLNGIGGSGSGSSQPTSPTSTTGSSGFLQPQRTGFGGSNIRPFKPSSSFGNTLMENLPPIHEPGSSGSNSTSPAVTSPLGSSGVSGLGGSSGTGFPGFTPQNQQQQQQNLQQNNQNQNSNSNSNAFGGLSSLNTQFTGFGGGSNNVSSATPTNPFGLGQQQNKPQQQQQNQNQTFGQFGGMQSQGTGQPNPFTGMGSLGQQQQQQQNRGPFGSMNSNNTGMAGSGMNQFGMFGNQQGGQNQQQNQNQGSLI